MKNLPLVLLLLFPAQGADERIPRTTAKDWTYTVEQINREGKREIWATIRGDEAKPVSDTLFDLVRPGAVYYTEPTRRQPDSQAVDIKADKGRYDTSTRTLKIFENVRVESEDGSQIFLDELTVDMNNRTFVTESPFRFLREGAELTGTGMDADMVFYQVVARRDAKMTIRGNPRALVPSRIDVPPEDSVTRLTCAGPMTVRELFTRATTDRKHTGEKHAHVEARDRVRLVRTDAQGETTLDCDFMRLCATGVLKRDSHDVDPAGPRKREYVIEGIAAWGNVTAAQGEGMRMKSDTARWSRHDDVLDLNAEKEVRTTREGMGIFSDRVEIDRAAQTARFLGRVRVEAEKKEDQPPLEASAERLEWDFVQERGVLTGDPYVTMKQEGRFVEATRVALVGRSLLILQGRKRVRIPQGDRTIFATCEGDVRVDSESGTLSLNDKCTVQAGDFSLSCDHLRARQSGEKAAVLEATGNIRVHRPADGLTLHGSTLRYDPDKGFMEVRGNPHVVAETAETIHHWGTTRFHEKTGRIEVSTDKGRNVTIVKPGAKTPKPSGGK